MAHSDKVKAETLAVLDSNAGNLLRTSKETGIPISTLSDWRDGRKINEDVSELRNEKKEELADIFERVSRQYLQEAENPYKIDKTSGKDAVMTAAIATDKMRLLREQATQINGSTLNPLECALMFIEECEDRGLSLEATIQGLRGLNDIDKGARERVIKRLLRAAPEE